MDCVQLEANKPWGFVIGAAGRGTLRFRSEDETRDATVLWDASYSASYVPATRWEVSFKPKGGSKFGQVSPHCIVGSTVSGYCRQDFTRVGEGEAAVYGAVADVTGEAVTDCQTVQFNDLDLATSPDGSFATSLAAGDYVVRVNGEAVDRLEVNGAEVGKLAVAEGKPCALRITTRHIKRGE